MFKRIRRTIAKFRKKQHFYLAGPISWVHDNSYIAWREDMEKFLASIGHVGINPLRKYNNPAKEKAKIEEMIVNQRDEISREYIRKRIINANIGLLKDSDAVIAYCPGFSPGTCAEIAYAYLWGKPVYIVTCLTRDKWSGWFVGLSTLIFPSWDELKKFLSNMDAVDKPEPDFNTCLANRGLLSNIEQLSATIQTTVREHFRQCVSCQEWATKHKLPWEKEGLP